MTRPLTLFLSLAIVAGAFAAPAFACQWDGVAVSDHSCCPQQALSAPPASTCCAVSQAAPDRAYVQSRIVRSAHSDIVIAAGASWLRTPDTAAHRYDETPPSARGTRSAPLYLQHLALLI